MKEKKPLMVKRKRQSISNKRTEDLKKEEILERNRRRDKNEYINPKNNASKEKDLYKSKEELLKKEKIEDEKLKLEDPAILKIIRPRYNLVTGLFRKINEYTFALLMFGALLYYAGDKIWLGYIILTLFFIYFVGTNVYEYMKLKATRILLYKDKIVELREGPFRSRKEIPYNELEDILEIEDFSHTLFRLISYKFQSSEKVLFVKKSILIPNVSKDLKSIKEIFDVVDEKTLQRIVFKDDDNNKNKNKNK